MGRKRKPYQRKTNYVPREERQFTVRPVFRGEPDIDKLKELFIRLALQRVAEARAARSAATGPAALKPGIHGAGTGIQR